MIDQALMIFYTAVMNRNCPCTYDMPTHVLCVHDVIMLGGDEVRRHRNLAGVPSSLSLTSSVHTIHTAAAATAYSTTRQLLPAANMVEKDKPSFQLHEEPQAYNT